jgi:hypothetical protein
MTSTNIYNSTILPYVYKCIHKATQEYYFGYRYANKVPSEKDLGFKYFTSSNYVKPRFNEFYYMILAEFFDKESAYDFEIQIITEHWGDPLLLNKHIGDTKFVNNYSGNTSTPQQRKKISLKKKGVKRGHWYNNGIKSTLIKDTSLIPKGWVKGRLFSCEGKMNMLLAHKGKIRSHDVRNNISTSLKGKPQSSDRISKREETKRIKRLADDSYAKKRTNPPLSLTE